MLPLYNSSNVDTSSYWQGSVVLQWQDDMKMLPITYASHAMSETETHYTQINKEALMTTWACECFSNYLIGLYFPIENNHKPLVPLLGSKDLGELPARLQRFYICLMQYGYTIFYVPENDTLLRAVLSNGLFKQDKGKKQQYSSKP